MCPMLEEAIARVQRFPRPLQHLPLVDMHSSNAIPATSRYTTHRFTKAVADGLNSRVQQIKKTAYGFRNLEHF